MQRRPRRQGMALQSERLSLPTGLFNAKTGLQGRHTIKTKIPVPMKHLPLGLRYPYTCSLDV